MTVIQEEKRLPSFGTRNTVFRAIVLAISCVITFWLVTHILVSMYSISKEDDLLGGMWAVVATIFVFRYSYAESVGAALSRISATFASCALCLVYLLIFPFSIWGMAGLIAIDTIALTMIGHTDDVMTASITTAVVMVVAAIAPHDAWRDPILRVVDTVFGALIGIGAARICAFGPHVLSDGGSGGRE